MIFGLTKLGLVWLLFCFCLLIQADWININSAQGRYVYNSGFTTSDQVMLVAGRAYWIVAVPPVNALDTFLTVWEPNGGSYENDDWTGSSFPKGSIVAFYASDGQHTIQVKGKSLTTGSFDLYVLDVSSCSNLCTDCQSATALCPQCVDYWTCNACSDGKFGYGGACVDSCPLGYSPISGSCFSCRSYDPYCNSCNATNCLHCDFDGFLQAFEKSCVWWGCPSGTYNNNGLCTSCKTLDNSCDTCSSSTACDSCSGSLLIYEEKCVSSCPTLTTYKDGTTCQRCSTMDSYCTTCNSSSTCLSCLPGQVALGGSCAPSCGSSSLYDNNGLCTSCKTMNDDCLTCGSSTSCTSCDNGKKASGAACVPSCPANSFENNVAICIACSTLDSSCIRCNSTLTCQACSGGLLALGAKCLMGGCPDGTYSNGIQCISCKTLDDNCLLCPNEKSCTSCDGGRLIYGSNCLSSCPKGASNNGGICTTVSLKITLANTDSVNIYLAQFPATLVNDIQIPVVSQISLVGVDPSAYTIELTKQTTTTYQITIQYSKTVPSAILRYVYTLNGVPATTNDLIGQWTAEITSKYMAYISEADKATVEAVNKVAGGGLQGAASGAGSMAILGGNPALLWPLLNLFQTFYYLIFIDVNYPANVQMFLKIFSLGSLGFIPNPLGWFVKDIDDYDLPVPKRYNDYNFSGLFLDNAGNEFLLLVLVFGLYLLSKAIRKWIRRIPASLRFASNKTVEWFEWSGILQSLITSYTDIAQAVFLQMKVLTFYSTVFTLSALLSFLALGFIVVFPALIFMIIRKFNDHPELLLVKYETLVREYNIKKKSSRNFVAIWLTRRLIMCLSLVFLQGYPYVQINILCILMIASILYSWICCPYATKKENICNTLMELFFGCIHGVIYILIYDDHNPSFTDEQRLQMGWVIIFACGIILLISLGLNIMEQVKAVIQGIRLLKKLMSKKDKPKNRKKLRLEGLTVNRNISTTNERVNLVDLNLTTIDNTLETSGLQLVKPEKLTRPPRNVTQIKKIRRAQLAHRIRELRGINS